MTGSPAGFESPVRLRAVPGDGQPDATPALEELYRGFEKELLIPLWTQIGDLMPMHSQSKAVAHRWQWEQLRLLAARAGELVPVGRGGEPSWQPLSIRSEAGATDSAANAIDLFRFSDSPVFEALGFNRTVTEGSAA